MAVRLDQVSPPASRPSPPHVWLWLGLLPLLLLLGVGAMLMFATQQSHQPAETLWALALGVPFLGWCLLGLVRVLLHIDQQREADGWDMARESDLIQKTRRGRRSQQVLSVSLHTALRDPGTASAEQLDVLLGGTKTLKAQPSRQDPATLCHSRLPCDFVDVEQALLEVMAQVLADLSPTLAKLPDTAPLALLLEIDSSLPEAQSRRVWQQAWSESGIRQSTVPAEGSGLDAVDKWLDQRITDQALLLVVAFQFAPSPPIGTSEVAVGVLFGNRLTQTRLTPIAYLHRPEQERTPTTEALLYAVRQALDWVPLQAHSIEHVWRVGIEKKRDTALTTVLEEVSMPIKHDQGFHNLDALLAHIGKASPWVAIAAATQTLQRGSGPQFIFSGGSCVDAALWGTVLTPVPALIK